MAYTPLPPRREYSARNPPTNGTTDGLRNLLLWVAGPLSDWLTDSSFACWTGKSARCPFCSSSHAFIYIYSCYGWHSSPPVFLMNESSLAALIVGAHTHTYIQAYECMHLQVETPVVLLIMVINNIFTTSSCTCCCTRCCYCFFYCCSLMFSFFINFFLLFFLFFFIFFYIFLNISLEFLPSSVWLLLLRWFVAD